MQNHKKQIALTGNPTLTYSPRSTGSGSSTASGPQKRKYATAIEHPIYNSRISCIYCTKSDFTNADQLNTHVQIMHARIETPTSIPSPTLTLTCEFCTMKCPSVHTLLHHLKTSHLDRISSPSSYLEHINKIPYEACTPSKRLNYDPPHSIKTEVKSPEKTFDKSESPITVDIKQENEQDSPTDLSQPKIKRGKEIMNHNNNNNIDPPSMSSPTSSSGTLLCNQCNAALPDFESFRKHLKTHLDTGVGNHYCQHCGMTFTDQQVYEKHVFSHFLMTSTEFTCSKSCGKTFTQQDDYQKHLHDSHIQSLFRCEICAEIFETKVSIQVHLAVAHSNEVKLSRCSACMEVFRNERDFRQHVRMRHIVSGAVQCIFCRTICSSELDMHFHLAAHARQFQCPICPESFHVEFLLDRHLQIYHAKDGYHEKSVVVNNNNNIDYASAVEANKLAYGYQNKLYNAYPNETISVKHPNLLHGLYDTINRTHRHNSDSGILSPGGANKDLMNIYNNRQEMLTKLNTFYSNDYHAHPKHLNHYQLTHSNSPHSESPGKGKTFNSISGTSSNSHDDTTNKSTNRFATEKGYSCGMCERNDFSTESEVHTHRKLAHNLKTGVSLRCAYCNGDFRSR